MNSQAGTVAGPRLMTSVISPGFAPVTVRCGSSFPPRATLSYALPASISGRVREAPLFHLTSPSLRGSAANAPRSTKFWAVKARLSASPRRPPSGSWTAGGDGTGSGGQEGEGDEQMGDACAPGLHGSPGGRR
ncbi:hypothetical protein [Streptomyces sp. NPDC090798]|uniref:hypothetical protein n=1 Tax=Streptomyces sp. NPDC090798 TaxID=3365968 RepID=UPI003822896F